MKIDKANGLVTSRRSFLKAMAAGSTTCLFPTTMYAGTGGGVARTTWNGVTRTLTAARAGGREWILAKLSLWEAGLANTSCSAFRHVPLGDPLTDLGWWPLDDTCGVADPFPVDVWDPHPGEEVWVVGFVPPIGRVEVPAMVASAPRPWPIGVVVSVPHTEEMYGSAVLNASGNLVGVVLDGMADPEGKGGSPLVYAVRVLNDDGRAPPAASTIPTLGIGFGSDSTGQMIVRKTRPPASESLEPGDVMYLMEFETDGGIAREEPNVLRAAAYRTILATIDPGRPVRVTVRRGRRPVRVEIVPRPAAAEPGWI